MCEVPLCWSGGVSVNLRYVGARDPVVASPSKRTLLGTVYLRRLEHVHE